MAKEKPPKSARPWRLTVWQGECRLSARETVLRGQIQVSRTRVNDGLIFIGHWKARGGGGACDCTGWQAIRSCGGVVSALPPRPCPKPMERTAASPVPCARIWRGARHRPAHVGAGMKRVLLMARIRGALLRTRGLNLRPAPVRVIRPAWNTRKELCRKARRARACCDTSKARRGAEGLFAR